jgi:hypothetical protein
MDAFSDLDPLGGKGGKSSKLSYPSYQMPVQQPPPSMNIGMNINLGMSDGIMGMNNGFMGQKPSMMGLNNMPGVTSPQAAVQQQPIMYDSIKNLLQKKPSAEQSAASGVDPFSCFTGGSTSTPIITYGNQPLQSSSDPFANTSTLRTNNSNTGVYDPFSGGSAPSIAPAASPFSPVVPAPMNLSIFGDSRETSISSSTSGNITTSSHTPKNNALADRLARGGKRQTQEAQRATLNIGTYAQSSAALSSPTVSIKKQLGGDTSATTTTTTAVSSNTSAPTSGDNLLAW